MAAPEPQHLRGILCVQQCLSIKVLTSHRFHFKIARNTKANANFTSKHGPSPSPCPEVNRHRLVLAVEPPPTVGTTRLKRQPEGPPPSRTAKSANAEPRWNPRPPGFRSL